MNSGVYGIRHIPTNKWYVGYSVNISNRWKQHRYQVKYKKKTGMMIHAAMIKHGIEQFEFVVLEYCQQSELEAAEIRWIHEKNSYAEGFNLTIRQRPVTLLKPRALEKMRKSHLGKSPTEETRKKLSEAMKGRIRTPEHCKKLSEALKNQVIPIEQRKKISETLKGRIIPEETRKRMSLGQLRRRQKLKENAEYK